MGELYKSNSLTYICGVQINCDMENKKNKKNEEKWLEFLNDFLRWDNHTEAYLDFAADIKRLGESFPERVSDDLSQGVGHG